jgi:glycosyltransferase involved in cell wall biosynthesis
MKVNFILPFTGMTGGIKIIFEYANRLSERGYDIVCYVPMKAYRFDNSGCIGSMKIIKASIGNTFIRGKTVKWFDLKVPIKLVPFIKNNFIRDADATIATAWPTAYDVAKLNNNKGGKFYFIQHYEIWSGPKEKVDQSYRLPLKQIVIAEWLRDLMKEKFYRNNVYLIHNGIDFNQFFNNHKKINSNKIVSMLYHDLEWKGYEDGLKAFELVSNHIPNLKLVLFGLKSGSNIPDYAEFNLKPSSERLKDIYSKSDVFIFPSRNEGWGLTPIEAMACKCAVVGTNTGAISEIGLQGKNMLISEPNDINALAKNLEKILLDEALLKNISLEGYRTALNLSWEKSVDKFEIILDK